MGQLLNLCHNSPSWSTRISGWDLLYSLQKQAGGVTATYLSNLHAQLRDIELFQSRAKNLMIKLISKIAADSQSVDLSSRVALLRRIMTVSLLLVACLSYVARLQVASMSDQQPLAGQFVFDQLLTLFEQDPEILNWWKMETDEELEDRRFDCNQYNTAQSHAELSPPWESSLLAACLTLKTTAVDTAVEKAGPVRQADSDGETDLESLDSGGSMAGDEGFDSDVIDDESDGDASDF
eukprot:Protomagalhaensia_wolfi_Nauph_80__6266@NODE_957_length_1852_cov_15_228902_g724_i0_p2_GENE_NODE_957_length_1852_cov_15_228902_g724_i0NODE_957_length_1852_cov_15_228902_g724_i0_p2_ORF_typecomplete_len237_score31_95CBF/PF03914_17/0_00015_NODE_957_length_1852_cov_15_228902_g724_i03001010